MHIVVADDVRGAVDEAVDCRKEVASGLNRETEIVEVVAGCPELPIREVLEKYMANSLETGANACGGEGYDHAHCHHHG